MNSGVRIPDAEREKFFAHEIPADVTTDYAVRRIALWQQFRDELQMRTMDSDLSGKFGGSRHGSVVAHVSNVVGTLVSRQSGKGSSEKGSSEGGRKGCPARAARTGHHAQRRTLWRRSRGKWPRVRPGGGSGGSKSLSAKESFVTRSPAASKVLVASFTESEVVRDIAPSGTLPSRPVSTLESSTHGAAAAAGGVAV